MNADSANKFIAALVKSLQTLCHGYVDFDDGIEIIGHLYLNIDSGSTFDYVVKEKVCKNADNNTVFLSKSFHAEGNPDNTLILGDKESDRLAASLGDHRLSHSGTNRLPIANVGNVLTHGHHSSHSSQNASKRKREHNGNYGQHPYKYTNLQQTSSSSAMPYFSNNPTKHHIGKDSSKHYSHSQNEFFGGDSNQSSGMGPDDEEDLNLDVTFVKEEYAERSRNAAAARAHQDSSNNQGNLLSENNGEGGNYSMGYHPNAPSHSFVGAGGGTDMSSLGFQDPSQVDMSQHHIPPPPNPRSGINHPTHLPQPIGGSTADVATSRSGGSKRGQNFQAPTAPTKYFRCNICGIIIRHKNNIKRHMRRHNATLASSSTAAEGSSNTLLPSLGPPYGLSSTPGEYSQSSGPSFSQSQPSGSGGGSSRIKVKPEKPESLIHTIRQNKWAVTRARDFLNDQGMSTNFEQFSDNQLNEMLLSFYSTAQKKDGSPFSGTALLAFRTAINRHLNQCGWNASLATSQAFKPSNSVLSRIISCTAKISRAIAAPDIIALYTNDILSNSNPTSLLFKVWFELQVHMRAKVQWEKVRVEQFMFSRNQAGNLCVGWNASSLGNAGQVSIQGTGGKYCPADSIRMYLQRRHKSCPAFLQVPAPGDMVKEGIWYAPEELKRAREKGFMKKISLLGKLSKTYTNSNVSCSYEEYIQAMLSLRTEDD